MEYIVLYHKQQLAHLFANFLTRRKRVGVFSESYVKNIRIVSDLKISLK